MLKNLFTEWFYQDTTGGFGKEPSPPAAPLTSNRLRDFGFILYYVLLDVSIHKLVKEGRELQMIYSVTKF